MSSEAKVPIEPEEQTALLDECSAIPGVIGGVVPGAGGYDAIALLIVDNFDVVQSLKRHLASRGGSMHVLGTRVDGEGLKVENARHGQYTRW